MARIGHGETPFRKHVLPRLKYVAVLCLVAGLLGRTALAARMLGRTSDARQEAPRRLAYQMDFSHPGRIHISLVTSSPVSGTEFLELPSRWADAHELEHAIENLKITGSEVSLEPAGRPSRFLLHAKAGTTMRLDYDLVQDWSGPFRSAERHHVLARPELVVFNGENGLVAPRIDGGAAVQVTFDFLHVPAGQSLVTSFGAETHQTVNGTWSEVANALFVAGELSTRRVSVLGGPVLLAVAGHWSFSEQELALKVHEILGAERLFWQTPAPPWYLVVLAPFEVGTSGGGGSAFTHAFGLYLAPGEPFGPETEALFAHEAFHNWNPTSLGTVADTQTLGWFVEGFTTYYQDVMLERSRLLDHAAYLKRVNTVFRDYLISPAGAPQGAAEKSLDDEETRYREPYLRGAMIAFWLDAQIAQQTAGRRSLDDLMRALLADRSQPLTEERVLAAAGRLVDAGTVRRLRSFVDDGVEVPLPVSLGPCVAFRPQQVWTFALGVPFSALARGVVLRDVDPLSAAYRAGLRDGQTMLAWSLWKGDPEREVVLSVRTPGASGTTVQIRYLPHGRQVTVPQAELIAGCSQHPAASVEADTAVP